MLCGSDEVVSGVAVLASSVGGVNSAVGNDTSGTANTDDRRRAISGIRSIISPVVRGIGKSGCGNETVIVAFSAFISLVGQAVGQSGVALSVQDVVVAVAVETDSIGRVDGTVGDGVYDRGATTGVGVG